MRKALTGDYRSFSFLIMLLMTALCLFPAGNGFAAWTNGQAADVVLGQPDFTTAGGLASATVLAGPSAAAIDPTTGDLWVVDFISSRVLKWTSADKYVSGSAASVVLGQPDFTTTLPNHGVLTDPPAADSLAAPTGVAVDSNGTLWVADLANSRVLRFDDAASKTNGAPADGVLGQPDFISNTPNNGGVGAHTLISPISVAVDNSGRLWVSDAANNRVLRYDHAASKPNGGAADGVLGQPDFASVAPGALSASSLLNPIDMAVEITGRLWVTDYSHNRVLRYDHAASKPNGGAADGVLGQVDFTSLVGGTTQNTFAIAYGVAVDWAGGLYVSDVNNNRILYFHNAAVKANGAAADNVFGQPDFTSNGMHLAATGLSGPWSVAFDRSDGRLWVADHNSTRVLSYFNAELVMPVSTSIPTLSEWGALLFSLLLAAVAVVLVRRRKCA